MWCLFYFGYYIYVDGDVDMWCEINFYFGEFWLVIDGLEKEVMLSNLQVVEIDGWWTLY